MRELQSGVGTLESVDAIHFRILSQRLHRCVLSKTGRGRDHLEFGSTSIFADGDFNFLHSVKLAERGLEPPRARAAHHARDLTLVNIGWGFVGECKRRQGKRNQDQKNVFHIWIKLGLIEQLGDVTLQLFNHEVGDLSLRMKD